MATVGKNVFGSRELDRCHEHGNFYDVCTYM